MAEYQKWDMPRFNKQKINLNHSFLDRADFEEFIDARDAVMHLFPKYQVFQNYLPRGGVLQPELATYLTGLINYAWAQNRRPVFCEIYSRGRAGALRRAFGGFHIAQYRDPLSQFGSLLRLVIEQGWWFFLAFPLQELGIGGEHPLYRVVPEQWRPPILPWGAEDHAQRWATDAEYQSMVASARDDTLENAFRWHLFSWFLSNLTAIRYSDLVIDTDKLHDDVNYRTSVIDSLASNTGASPDLSDLTKFTRYYEFESFDVATVCGQVVSTIKGVLSDGRLESALSTLGTQPTTPTTSAVELLLATIDESLKSMATSNDRRVIRTEDWKKIAQEKQRPWFNPAVRQVVQRLHAIAVPASEIVRKVRNWIRRP